MYFIGVEMFYMGDNRNLIKKCVDLALDFLEDICFIRVLDIIIDIYNDVIYCRMDKETAGQKFLKVLYNLKNSQTFDSLLEEGDRIALKSFLGDLLQIKGESDRYYIGNEDFKELSLEDFYHFLIELKYRKEEIKDEEAAT